MILHLFLVIKYNMCSGEHIYYSKNRKENIHLVSGRALEVCGDLQRTDLYNTSDKSTNIDSFFAS